MKNKNSEQTSKKLEDIKKMLSEASEPDSSIESIQEIKSVDDDNSTSSKKINPFRIIKNNNFFKENTPDKPSSNTIITETIKKGNPETNEDGTPIILEYINQCNDEELIQKLKNNGKLPNDYENNMICNSKNYIKKDPIGSGSFNTVFELEEQGHENTGIETDVVLRKMKFTDKIKNNSRLKEVEENELAGLFIQAYLSKPNPYKNSNTYEPLCNQVCRVYEFGRISDENNTIYAIIEKLVPGKNFFETIETKNFKTLFPTPIKFCLNIQNILKDILKGLVCIHSHHFAHLDLKLLNIGLTNLKYSKVEGYAKKNENELIGAKLFDFGFAKYFPEEDSINIVLHSKKNYMAPETNRDEFAFEFLKSDVYMFGMMLYLYFLREFSHIYVILRTVDNIYNTTYLSEFQDFISKYTEDNKKLQNNSFINLALYPCTYNIEKKIIDGFKDITETIKNKEGQTIKKIQIMTENIFLSTDDLDTGINNAFDRKSAEELLENFESLEKKYGGKLHKIRKRNRTKNKKNKKIIKRKTSKKK